MPKDMGANLNALKNELSQPGAWVWLMTLTLPDAGGTYRWAANHEDVSYGGNTYTAFGFKVDGFTSNTDGELPELTLTVTNIGFVIQDDLRNYDGLVGGTISYVQVNTDYLSEDYSEDAVTLTIVGAENRYPDIALTLSVPPQLRRRVPNIRMNPHSCPHRFRKARCSYVGETVTGVTLPSGNPVIIGVTAHGFATGSSILLETINGITPSLAGVWTITSTGADTFTLDGTDGDDYSGSYTSGGKAGYAYCNQTPEDCQERELYPVRYGGPLSMRPNVLRYA
jgi:phage-related protein